MLDCGIRGYGSGYAALLSPVKSIAEYSLSLDSRWKPSTIRSVPDFERITIDWVVQPPGSIAHTLEQVAVGDAGRAEEDVLAGHQIPGGQHLSRS